jgi:hypothetical protein
MPAVGSTYLQVVNAVLKRLREGTMADFTAPTTYQQFIMDLVNSVKQEVEKAWFWHALRDTFEITTTASIINYAFTGAGAEARILNGWNESGKNEIVKGTNQFFDSIYLSGGTIPTGFVSKYITNSVDESYDLKIDVYPSPNSAQVLNFNLYVPQADLAAVGNVPKVHPLLLIEGTLAYALTERGDETAGQQTDRYARLLSDFVAADAGRNPEELDWCAA